MKLQALIDHLNQYNPLSDEEIAFVKERIGTEVFSKGDYLLKEGEISRAFFFNLSGMVRLFYSSKGEEKTAYFYSEGVFISAYSSFMRQQPAQFYLQAMEETRVAVIGTEDAEALLRFSPKFEALARIAMEEELISHQEIIASLLTLDPEQRYIDLLTQRPEIFRRVPQVHIASYIGVQPESLSRIKKRYLENLNRDQ